MHSRDYRNEDRKNNLDKILEAGRVASACNRQPQRIIVVEKPETSRRSSATGLSAPLCTDVCQDKSDPLIRPFDGKCSGDLDIGIICDHMMLAARELNIGSVMVGLFDPVIIRKEFGIPEYIEPTALLLLGYPSDRFLSSDRHSRERKAISETVMFEQWKDRSAENQKCIISRF